METFGCSEMFSRQSPRKRKHSEYHDPDYPRQHSTCDERTICSNQSATKRPKVQECFENSNKGEGNEHFQKIQDIVEKEFNCEISFKQNQLKRIDERLLEAGNLLDSLRYALISSYYRKQDLPLAAVTASAVRSAQHFFNREDKGPQIQMHPSLKKLIGKNPKMSDVIRSCPKRTAAQNAVQTIRAKSEIQRREERKLKQIIRGQGIVIDHSVQREPQLDVASLLNAAHRCKISTNKRHSNSNVDKSSTSSMLGKPLMSARLNNKVKHLIVVGNTSKFIGDEQERDPLNKSQIFTHKWLVYVQAKESAVPIERYVRKIRFYLHHSYRPNDVVDIQSPPFHVARRGWGEFPIRIQLYFHHGYHQKPVQLLHTVVLDKTLSGIQTLGAETLLEVWLRNATYNGIMMVDPMPHVEIKNIKTKQYRKSSEDLVDDNLLEFLNKIESAQNSISADIEKIQPTFVATKLLNDKRQQKQDDPSKIPSISPNKNSENITSPGVVVPDDIKNEVRTTDIANQVKTLDVIINHALSTINPSHITTPSKTSVVVNKDCKILMPLSTVASVVRKTILPVVANTAVKASTIQTTPASSSYCYKKNVLLSGNPPKQILQKKLVQLIDATGKVKYMQMLVATSTAPPAKNHDSSLSMAPKLISSCSVTKVTQSTKMTTLSIQKITNGVNLITTPGGLAMKPNIFKIVPENMQTKPKVVTFSTINEASTTNLKSVPSSQHLNKSTTSIVSKLNSSPSKMHQKSSGSTTKNLVFHKEGKVYIIDPLQIKLKQQQKKQVSLLKPQVSLLKQQMQQQHETLTTKTPTKTLDHKYLSASNLSIQNNAPQVHFGLKQQRLNTLNTLQLSQMKRILFEKQILRQEFANIQYAVEFILRRLKLIAPKESIVSAFPFVTHTEAEFQSLTAFKQRTYEWLRAKHISRLLRHHKDLQKINNITRETFWSTKEIANFARQYAYTPNIKSLPRIVGKHEGECNYFKELVKGELKQKEITPYDTLTDYNMILKWINKTWPILVDYQHHEDQQQIIDVDNISKHSQEYEDRTNYSVHSKTLTNLSSNDIYLSAPAYLENECNLVTDICKDLSIQILPEELVPNIWHPTTKTILAQCLNIFLQKIIRKVVSLKHQDKKSAKEIIYSIQPTDIAKVLSQSADFDFLTNNNFGSDSSADGTLISFVKQEKS